MSRVYVVGTADTKGEELRYVRDLIAERGCHTTLVDVGTGGGTDDRADNVDVSPDEVAAHHPDGATAVQSDDRGTAVGAMAVALEHFMATRTDVAGMIGLGGSGGTALISPAMRSLPVGVPKVLVSTVASGDVSPYVGPADIAMMYSVTDVAGLNRISRRVLGNAANAVAGMAANPVEVPASNRPVVGMTMFGVTTPLVTMLAETLEQSCDPLIFHATGTGGQSMEKLVDSGMIDAVLDMTTTEVADHLVGGVFSAGPDRLGAIARTGVPYVGSCGALDMVNFGAVDTVPAEFKDRLLHVHNANVTLMRTTPEENRQMGRFIATKLNQCQGPIRFLLPEGGVSMIDAPGQVFYDPEADAALFETIESEVEQTENRRVVRVPHNINDAEFAAAAMTHLDEVFDRSAKLGAD